MTVYVLVEGPSERVLFGHWGRRVIRNHDIRIHPHQGKGKLQNAGARQNPKARGLLDQLPAKLRGFSHSLDPQRDAVLVLVDADDDNPDELANSIRKVAAELSPQLLVLVSVAVEEMEAFYLGDQRALREAYPQADMQLARLYQPDSICGTWEYFGKVVGDDGSNKVPWAEAMGPRLGTRAAQNRSPSFGRLIGTLAQLDQPRPVPLNTARRRRHRPRPSTPDGRR